MKKKLIILLVLVISLLLVTGVTKALYASNSIWDYYLNSKGFYFENDYDKTLTLYNYWDGNSIDFTVLNSKKNKYTDDNITYEVTCNVPNGVTCKINGSTGKYTSTLQGGRKSTEKVYIAVETTNKDVEVEIVTKSTAPYTKTIRNRVFLHKDESVAGSFNYDLINYSNYSILNISNYYNQDKCFNVRWNNSNLKVSVEDVTPVASDSNGYINEFNKNVPRNDTVSIKFYNESNVNYNKGIFQISECSLES